MTDNKYSRRELYTMIKERIMNQKEFTASMMSSSLLSDSDSLSSFSPLKSMISEEDMIEISYMDELFQYFEKDWDSYTDEHDNQFQAQYKFTLERLNVFKNILRAFKNYMKTKGDSVVIECMDSLQKPINIIKKQFNFFSKRHAPNSRLLSLLFCYDRYGRQFEYFLNHYSLEWLASSKVKDLTQHIYTILYLCRCFKNESMQQNIKVNKK
ncbi:hypothetical protein ABPG72_004889 [Tetrahymena utriculariae]